MLFYVCVTTVSKTALVFSERTNPGVALTFFKKNAAARFQAAA
jgi:hypothetical protein